MQLHPEALFLLQAIILIGLPLLLWRIHIIRSFAPLVVIQIVLGLLLGPTVFGRFAPNAFQALFPASSLMTPNSAAWLGVCLLGFLTGLHFDFAAVAKKSFNFIATSLSTLLVPMIFGILLAAAFYRDPFISGDTSITLHTLGIAIAIAVTAMPVLSAILIELKIIDTPMGRRVLGYAAANDTTLWLGIAALSVFTSSSASEGNWLTVIVNIVLAIAFVVFMATIVRKFCFQLVDRNIVTEDLSAWQLGLILTGVLAAALTTELLNIHFLLGAFMFGAVMPKSLSSSLFKSFEKFTMVALMPFYFMLTGLKTSFGLSDTNTWILFICATAVAIFAKIVGTAVPERLLNKVSMRESLSSGILMQTKGPMEIVVLNILLQKGIINTTVFSALVLMAVTTTLLAKPLMKLIGTPKFRRAADS